jgi:uncharacterized membrane protein YdbT with pleckstrin-like domain
MIAQNTQNKLPGNVLTYKLVGNIIIAVVLIVVAFILMSLGTIHGTSTVNGVTSPATFNLIIPAIVLIVLGLIFPLYTIAWYATFSFIVADQSITINSGVVVKRSKTIDFNKVQNVNNVRGPLQMIFGLAQVDLWTASQDQISFSTVSYGNGRTGTRMQAKPEGRLYLLKQDAEDLKNVIAQKGTVQNVKVV